MELSSSQNDLSKGEAKHRALTHLGFDPNVATMALENSLNDQ
jgi:hypothetical protein